MTDITKSLRFLESQDLKTFEEARGAILLQIDQGNGIRQLVHYYSEQRSERALDLLCSIREPNDKNLLDTINECFGKQKLAMIILLGQILQTAPSWVPKISFHPLFANILKHMCFMPRHREPQIMVEEIAVLLFICNLLPCCSSLPDETLKNLFRTFITAAEILRQKKKEGKKMDEMEFVHVSHLDYALREYFFTLYGIYPNNFIAFMKNYFSDPREERQRIYRAVVRPLTACVRLHPNLLELTPNNELGKERWAQREPHDFLDECRKIMIGVIPISTQIGDEPNGEEDDFPSYGLTEVYQKLFPSKSSAVSSSEVGGEEESIDMADALMTRINTPPGSRPGSPVHKRSLDDSSLVLDGRRRRSTVGSDEGRRTSFRAKVSKAINVLTRGERRAEHPPLVEVEVLRAEEEEENRRHSENSQPEEAEEAVAMEEMSPVSVREVSLKDHNERVAADIERQRMMQEAAHAAREAARKSVETIRADARRAAIGREREEDELGPVPRSRSTSFLYTSRDKDVVKKGPATTSSDGDQSTTLACSNSDAPFSDIASGDAGRSRFSVTSFFKKLNRQRFRSECPPTEGESPLPGLLPMPGEAPPHATLSTSLHATLKRTSSCPVLPEDGAVSSSLPADSSRLSREQPPAPPDTLAVFDTFPYLALVREPSDTYFTHLENGLENKHELRREKYMEASKDFHHTLKEFNLADRLPGRIYDDLNNILQGQPLDKQRDLLRCRLMLVNQHLLYERTCRLLHANRNRRLFGRIKQQKVAEVQLRNFREKEHEMEKEKQHLITALTGMRKGVADTKMKTDAAEAALTQKVKEKQKEVEEMARKLAEAEHSKNRAEIERDALKGVADGLRRRADDAEEEKMLLMQELQLARGDGRAVASAQAETQALRDHIKMMEKSRREEVCDGGDWEGRMKELEAEAERVRREAERGILALEEMKARKEEAESALKVEVNRGMELRHYLERAAKLLREQNEAAQQKFLSLQAVTQKQEEYILQLHRRLEELTDIPGRRGWAEEGESSGRLPIPRNSVPADIHSYDSSHGSDAIARSLLLSAPPAAISEDEHLLADEVNRISL